MTRTFERFLRSMSDEELERFASERASVRPPYWRMLHVAVRIEAGRRGLDLDMTGHASSSAKAADASHSL